MRMNLEEYRNIPVRIQDLDCAFPDCKDLAGKMKRLEEAGEVIRLKRGLYVVAPRISRLELSTGLIANHLYNPSYVSMETALRHYGLIPEAVYETISITTGVARTYQTPLGPYRYIHANTPYYNIGVRMEQEAGCFHLMATPEKALADKIMFTPRLNLRYKEETLRYLEDDLRLDMDAFKAMDVDLMKRIATVSRKKTMIQQLIKLMEQ
jgi:hypothetical protein